jgi:CheY-like chemotaxis protein
MMPEGCRATTILVVDDEVMIQRTISRVLERAGYRGHTAGSGEEALALVRREHVDAVICDFNLPGVSGARLCEQIWLAAPGLVGRLVVASGDLRSDEVDQLVRRTGLAPLGKPFTAADLLRVVGAICPLPPSSALGERRAAS